MHHRKVSNGIPIFTSQLEKSREAVDAANIRAAYAEISADALTGDLPTNKSKYTVTLKQKQSGWQTEFDFPENLVAQDNAQVPAENGTVTFDWDATNNQVKASVKLTKGTN